MDVYVAWSDGYWCAYAMETGFMVVKALMYHTCRRECAEKGYYVQYVRARE